MPDCATKTVVHAELATQAKSRNGKAFIQKSLPVALMQLGLKGIDVSYVNVSVGTLIFKTTQGTRDREMDKIADELNGMLKAQQPTRTVLNYPHYSLIHKQRGNLKIAQEEFVNLLETPPHGRNFGITLEGVGHPNRNPAVHFNVPLGMEDMGELFRLSNALYKRLERKLAQNRQSQQQQLTLVRV